MATAIAVVKRDRLVRYLAWLVVVASVLTIWPPIRIHRLLSSTGQTDSDATVQARRIADSFWNGTLAAGAVNALDIRTLVELLQTQPAAAQRSGHTADYRGGPDYAA